MQNLGHALIDVRENLLRGETDPEDVLVEAAEEYRLNPELLRRKWIEQYGCGLDEWLERQTENQQALVEMSAGARQAAQRKARELAATWLIPAPRQSMIGRLFKIGRHEYAFAVFANDHPKWAIRAIRVLDGKLVNFRAERWKIVEPQIADPPVRMRVRPVAQETFDK